MQRTTSGAAGNGLYTTIKCMRGAAGNGLGITIKYLPATPSECRRDQRPKHHGQVPCELNAGAFNNWAKAHTQKSWERLLLNSPS
jgi:hypothetical protein